MTEFRIAPCTIKDARRFIAQHHRHNAPPNGGLFATGVIDQDGERVGVGIAAMPVAKNYMHRDIIEITRVCVVDAPMACSMIYGSLCRAAKALGWKTVVTYTLASEPGTSPRAAGFRLDAENIGGMPWNHAKRQRCDNLTDLFGSRKKYSAQKKNRWMRDL